MKLLQVIRMLCQRRLITLIENWNRSLNSKSIHLSWKSFRFSGIEMYNKMKIEMEKEAQRI